MRPVPSENSLSRSNGRRVRRRKIVQIPRVHERQERLTFPINLHCVFRHKLVSAFRNAMHNVTKRYHRGNIKNNRI